MLAKDGSYLSETAPGPVPDKGSISVSVSDVATVVVLGAWKLVGAPKLNSPRAAHSFPSVVAVMAV